MTLSTQILFLFCCCFFADSHLLTIDLYNGDEVIRIPVGLPEPFKLYPGMFDPPLPKPYRQREKSDISSRTPIKDKLKNSVTNKEEAVSTTTEKSKGNIIFRDSDNEDFDTGTFLMNNVKVDNLPSISKDDVSPASFEEKSELPHVNTLSVHEEPKLSKITPDESNKLTREVAKSEEIMTETDAGLKTEANDTNVELSSNTDYVLIPINAVNINTNTPDKSNNLSPMSAFDNRPLFNQGYPIPNGNIPNNYNAINQIPYGNQPLQFNNGINPQIMNGPPNQINPSSPPNLYTIVNVPNGQGNIPNYYLNNGYPNNGMQPNSPQYYNLVPINNTPNNNPGQQYGFLPYSNQPNNYGSNNVVPVNSQPNNFIPTNNYVPINQPNNFLPNGNQPQNINVPINFVPNNNVPNNFIPNNNGPNNFYPNNNVPNNLYPNNNLPNNFISNNNVPTNFPNNYIPNNNIPNNAYPNNNVPNNFNRPNNFAPNNLLPQGNSFFPFKDPSQDPEGSPTEVTTEAQPNVTIVAVIPLNDNAGNEKENTTS